MCTWLPVPAEPKVRVLGFSFASAISSFMVFAGTAGCTISSIGPLAMLVIGAKSFFASNGILSL